MAKQIMIIIIAIIIFIRYYVKGRISYYRKSREDAVLVEAARQNFRVISSVITGN